MRQNTQEWLEKRKTCIGASDAPIILGASPWKTPLQLWEEKMGFREPAPMNAAMQRGIDLEPLALQEAEKVVGVSMLPQVLFDKERPWMMASLDGLSLDGLTACEVKVPGRETVNLAKDGQQPNHYWIQNQHQLYVAGLQNLLYLVYTETECYHITVDRDDAFISDELLPALDAFYKCMENREPPKASNKDYEHRDDARWAELATKMAELEDAKKALEAEQADIRKQLEREAGERSCKGAGVTLARYWCKGRVDYKAIPELAAVDLERYRGAPSMKWRLTYERPT